MSDPILAWHFLREDGKFRYSDNRKPQIGKVYRAKGALELCENGMHASASIIDALRHAPGPLLCRVEMVAPIIQGNDKLVARGRKILWRIDATEVLHRFAVSCAQRALRKTGVADQRCWDACRTKLRWLGGKATDEELAAARDAARAAAWAAAWAAARAAARAAAWAAASDAARAAARAAASDAAWAAARAAAWAAASDAVWAAARAAASDDAWAAARAAASDDAWAAASDDAWAAAWAAARAAEKKWQEKKMIQLIKKFTA